MTIGSGSFVDGSPATQAENESVRRADTCSKVSPLPSLSILSVSEQIRHSLKASVYTQIEDCILSKLMKEKSSLFLQCLYKAIALPQINLSLLTALPMAQHYMRSFVVHFVSFLYIENETNKKIAFYDGTSPQAMPIIKAKYFDTINRYFIALSYIYQKLGLYSNSSFHSLADIFSEDPLTLVLSKIPIFAMGLDPFSVIRFIPSSLTALDLSCCYLTDKETKALFRHVLDKCPQLTELNLSDNFCMTDNAFDDILDSIFQHLNFKQQCPLQHLKLLNISGNRRLFLSADMILLFCLPSLENFDVSDTALCGQWGQSTDLIAVASLLKITICNGSFDERKYDLNLNVLVQFWRRCLGALNISSFETIYSKILEEMAKNQQNKYTGCADAVKREKRLILKVDKTSLNDPNVISIFLKLVQKNKKQRLDLKIENQLVNGTPWISVSKSSPQNMDDIEWFYS